MREGQESIEQLRRSVQPSGAIRLMREVATGFGVSMFCLSASIAEDILTGRAPSLGYGMLMRLLLGLSLAYALVMSLVNALLPRFFREHYAEMMSGSEILLWIVTGDLPPEQSRLAARLRSGRTQQGFQERLRAVVGNWQALCNATAFTPWPRAAWLRWLPALLALGWTGTLALIGQRMLFNQLLYPVVFIALALHLNSQLLTLAREQFVQSLADALSAGGR